MDTRTLLIGALLLACLPDGAVAAEAPAPDGRYTAVLHQRINLWQLMPPSGPDIQVTMRRSVCRPGTQVDTGEWRIEQDADGRLTLRPTTGAARDPVPLVACGDDTEGPAVQAPPALIDWIAGVADIVVIR